jgi:hypothetical protein
MLVWTLCCNMPIGKDTATVNSQQSTVNSQQSTVNSQQSTMTDGATGINMTLAATAL